MADETADAPPKYDPETGRYSVKYMQWLEDACQRCTEDGENGSCLIGLSGCKWY